MVAVLPSAGLSRDHAFRADIEGLRALAVLGVILYHTHMPGFGGGFVGVDVFFVISGFLICGLLQRELLATGSIDVIGFWMRRCRRLMPNAVLTLLATLVAAAFLLPAYTLADHAKSIAAAALYLANFHFTSIELDYFIEDDGPSPVLHFWSLSVEEQFYLVWPMLLIALILIAGRRAARWSFWLILALTFASLWLALETIAVNRPKAFYHPEMRAWQLGLGGLLAIAGGWLDRVPVQLRIAAGWLGLAVILACMTLYSDVLPYPGVWALTPTLATAAVLMAPAAPYAPVSVLGLALCRWVGARSYSLYLWHWPALIFAGVLLPDSPLAMPLGLLAGLALAMAAYHYVETPLRHGQWWPSSRRLTLATAASALALVLSAAWLLANPLVNGSPVSAEWVRKVKMASADRGRNIKAKCNRVFDQTDQPLCAYGDVTARRTVVLFGDSHAAQWFEAVDKAARAEGWRLLTWTKSACPAAEVTIWHRKFAGPFTPCDVWRDQALQRLADEIQPELVFVSSYVASARFTLDPAQSTILAAEPAHLAWRDGMAKTLQRLQSAGIEPVVIADTPNMKPSYKGCLETGQRAACGRARDHALPHRNPDREAAEQAGVALLDLTDKICDKDFCPAIRKGKILYRDTHHLTARYAATFAPAFADILRRHGEKQECTSPEGCTDSEALAWGSDPLLDGQAPEAGQSLAQQ